MVKINLKDYYPLLYERDVFVEVYDELAAQLKQWQRDEETYQRKKRRYHTYCSQEYGSQQYNEKLYLFCSPYDVYERKLAHEHLLAAISCLTPKQAKRIFLHYFMGMSQAAIARAEQVSRNTVSTSIHQALASLKTNLSKFSKRG